MSELLFQYKCTTRRGVQQNLASCSIINLKQQLGELLNTKAISLTLSTSKKKERLAQNYGFLRNAFCTSRDNSMEASKEWEFRSEIRSVHSLIKQSTLAGAHFLIKTTLGSKLAGSSNIINRYKIKGISTESLLNCWLQ